MTASTFAKDPRFMDCKMKLIKTMNSKLLDYKHEHPANVLQTLEVLDTLFSNIIDNPNESKFRKIRASNSKFASAVGAHEAAVEFLALAGWHSRVENLEKQWMFERPLDSLEFSVFAEASDIIKRAVAEARTKAIQAAKLSDKKGAAERERAKILAAMRDDRELRSERIEQQALALRQVQEQKAAREEQERQLREEQAAQLETVELRERLAASRGASLETSVPLTESKAS
eukprot:jgi/Botrbrau1/10192/Bobra.116_1s0008.1